MADDGKDDGEWKSSHERFVEALERIANTQERTSFGFFVEVPRAELLAHLEERAAHYAAEVRLKSEMEVDIDAEIAKQQMRLARYMPEGLRQPQPSDALREEVMAARKRAIDNLRARAQQFAFMAKYLPKTKQIYVLDMGTVASLEMVPVGEPSGPHGG